jgi:hypothetical protein
MFRQFAVLTVLPNLRRQISVICLLSIKKIPTIHMGYVLFWSPCTSGYTDMLGMNARTALVNRGSATCV